MPCIPLLKEGESKAAATKYIAVKMFWFSDYIKTCEMCVEYLPTER